MLICSCSGWQWKKMLKFMGWWSSESSSMPQMANKQWRFAYKIKHFSWKLNKLWNQLTCCRYLILFMNQQNYATPPNSKSWIGQWLQLTVIVNKGWFQHMFTARESEGRNNRAQLKSKPYSISTHSTLSFFFFFRIKPSHHITPSKS